MSEQGDQPTHGFWGETDGAGVLEQYRTLINTIDDGIYQLDADGRFVAVNDVIIDRLGYSRDDLIGTHVSTILDDPDVDRIGGAIRQLLETPDDVATMEVPVESADGERVFFELRINLLEEDDELTGTIGVAREVTDRRTRERQLERERNQTEKLLETAPVAVAVSDSDGETIRANQRAQEFLGLTEAELVDGPPDADAWTTYDADGNELPEDDLPEARVLETAEPVYDEEIAIEDPDGDRMWFRLNSAPVFDDNGNLDRIITTGEDVTELKNRERQLERRKNELETELSEILGRVSDGFFAVNEDWAFTHVNERAHDLINPGGPDLVGTDLWETFPESSGRVFREYYEHALTEQVTVSFEAYYPDPLNTWFEVRAYPSETGLSVYFRDVTDRKEREHQLEQYETIVETINDGIYVVDTDGYFTMVNDAYTELTGYSRDDLIGAHASLVVEDEVRAQAVELESAMRRDDAALQVLDATVETASGEPIDVEATFALFDGPSGDERRIGVVRDISRRKERERELAKYETIVETMNDGIYVKDEDGRFAMVNDAYAAMTGYDREELVGAHASLVVDEDAIEQSRDRLHTPPPSGSTMEAAIETASGDTVPAEGTFAAIETDGERQEIGVVRDITDRKEYERRIQESERRYRTLVENFPNGSVGLFDHDLEYTAVGGDLFESRGVDPADRIGASIYDIYPEDLVEEIEPHFEAALAGESRSFEVEYAGLELANRTLPVGDVDGEPQGMLLVQDVSEQREHERDLELRAREQEIVADLGLFALETDDLDELMREATRQIADALDTDYAKVLELDEDASELWLRQGYGWSEDVVGHVSVGANRNSQAGYTLLSKEPIVVEDFGSETRFTPPDLLTSHGLTSGVSTIVGPYDDPWGILETHATDVRSYSAEDVDFVQSVATILADAIERERYNAEREALVEELEASNERLEQFAYAASHDLQEPLRMVSSYLSLIERRYEDVLDEAGKEFLEYAVDGAERMREMIDALLAYSRVDTRGDPFEPVALDSVVSSVLADYQVRIRETNADVTTTNLPTVYGDADQLRQVFGNLLSNALEYSGDDPPTVRVFAERADDRWVIGVEDDGIGIEAEHEERVFEVFQRLHTQEEHRGTGIGLALAQRIVERHEGDIWVESVPGEGSTFYCSLPLVEESNE